MTDIRRSVIWTFSSTNGVNIVNFAVNIWLARLLTPSDIGIFSMTVMMVSVAHYFRDFGVASYLQQAKTLTPHDVAAASGLLITTSWTVAAITFALSWPLGDYMGQDGVREVVQVLALGFIVIPFGAVTHNLLARDYRGKEHAIVRAVSTMAYSVSVLWLAHKGFGYMSLAWANLINIIMTALAYLPYRMKGVPWLPRFNGWTPMLHFGGGALLGNGLAAVNNAIPEVMLGKLSGPHDVGLLSRATGVTGLIYQVVGPALHNTVLPFMSKAHHAGEVLNGHLTRTIELVTGVLWPALICVAIFAEPLVLLLYGPRWKDSIAVVPVVCLAALLSAPFSFTSTGLMAMGKAYWSALPAALGVGLRLAVVPLIYDGTLTSFAWGLLAAAVLSCPLQIYLQSRMFGLRVKDFFLSLRRGVLLSIGVAVLAYGLQTTLKDQPPMLTMGVALLVMPLAWLGALKWGGHPLWGSICGYATKSS